MADDKRLTRRLAALLAFTLGLYMAVRLVMPFVALFDSAPVVVEATPREDAQVTINATGTTTLLWRECVRVNWSIQGIEAIYLNGEGRAGVGSEAVCGQPIDFRVQLDDEREEFYRVPRVALLETPTALLSGLALVIGAFWMGAYWLGRTRLSPLEVAGRELNAFFGASDHPWAARVVAGLTLTVLFALGIAFWLNFYNLGNVALDAEDWQLTRRYWEVIEQGYERQQIPFFLLGGTRNTNRFMGNPDPSLTPFLLLAGYVGEANVALLTTLASYTVGFIGLALIARRYRLAPAVFAVLWMLFSFNGFITSHLTVGHVMWNAYFLFSWLVLWILKLLDDAANVDRAGLKIALVLAVMTGLGAFHMVLWWVFTLLLLAVSSPRHWRAWLLGIGFGLLLSAFRYLPAALVFGGEAQTFYTGFPTLESLIAGLTEVRSLFALRALEPDVHGTLYVELDWWEFDVYIGLLGLAFVAVLGIGLRFVRRADFTRLHYPALDLPISIMALLSLGILYRYVAELPLPLVSAERVTTRFLIVPLVFLIVLACLRAQALLPAIRTSLAAKLIVFGLLAQQAHTLYLHGQIWNVAALEAVSDVPYVPLEPGVIVDLGGQTLTTSEILYILSVPVGFAVSAVALLLWFWLYRRAGRS